MAPRIHADRIRVLASGEPRRGAEYVLYWMQASQRAEDNPALEYAAARANSEELPLIVGFGLMDAYPEANARHYRFMLDGLGECARTLAKRGIAFVVRHGSPDEVALDLARRAALVVCDRGYLRLQKAWRARVAAEARVEVVEVEGDVVVPVDAASDKQEYAARTLRPKIMRQLDEHLVPVARVRVKRPSIGLGLRGLDVSDADRALAGLAVDTSVPPVPHLRGGTSQARAHLEAFLDERLRGYREQRGQPQTEYVSHLAAYLHFGQVSPVTVALAARDAGGPAEDTASFLDELIVRRELGVNFCEHAAAYDSWKGLPAWARATLTKHRDDEREALYSPKQLEAAATEDPYWNAAQRELVHTGYMHNHMRMYWGKQILAWSPTPERAYRTALALNNRYLLEGRDPASFSNIGWLFGLHDRPWGERAVFGTVRSMTRGGLRRKADPDAYVARVERRIAELGDM